MIVLDGIANFEDFGNKLTDCCSKKNVFVTESREYIDYDHPFFYAILGIAISILATLGMKFMINTSPNILNIIFRITSLYVAIMGVFFLLNRPITKRYSDKKPFSDIMFGIIFICSAVLVYVLGVKIG